MQIDRIPFPEVPQFSEKDVAYATADERLRPFYKYGVNLESFAEVMTDKARDNTDRTLLVKVLTEQYDKLPEADLARSQVQSLGESNVFTVITAHQPSLFTGPLYFIYKICSAINLARQLNERYPDHKIVPVFIVGGEDHDFEEINHARIDGNKVQWDNGGTGGSVGAMSTESLRPALAALSKLLGTPDSYRGRARKIYERIEKAYTQNKTYGAATVALVHDLFGQTGLVVADMAKPEFKAAFRPIMEREIFEQVSQPLMEKAQRELTDAGFSGQAHAREINLFYLTDGRRDRIVNRENKYRILDTELEFTETGMRQELIAHPEKFSPNVVMRPLFQELIFPNLAYIGGGGELAYWLERKEQFVAFDLNFPMLVRRSSVLWVGVQQQKKISKLGIAYGEVFREADLIIRDYVARHSANDLSLEQEVADVNEIFARIAAKALKIDPTLEGAALAEGTRQVKIVENFESRFRRVEKQRFAVAMTHVRTLRADLFPHNSLQERKDNFLNIYLREGEKMFEVLIDHLDPLTPGLVVVSPEK
ncbi:bacillithiol biosynthesis cysteine-adding enzyme BshC [Neolewinella antarctica]|uniref:Putative cysteine ligase BshC n=1 Tax=Neolewinella antarctica TaxID=442734 RepID=A0ABX0X7A4_9BACT|nr:bacillithiol biosynthesis cysteine-adding enzyme BshC [Neolewinella antarctica]NJC25076.1 bacillithiol biosynthesis cysteine-adding enzyme BshC [Neolewinella antarctica]